MSKKFWQVKNYVNAESEILLYGPIASEHSWFGDEVTAKDFANDLESLGNAPVPYVSIVAVVTFLRRMLFTIYLSITKALLLSRLTDCVQVPQQ